MSNERKVGERKRRGEREISLGVKPKIWRLKVEFEIIAQNPRQHIAIAYWSVETESLVSVRRGFYNAN